MIVTAIDLTITHETWNQWMAANSVVPQATFNFGGVITPPAPLKVTPNPVPDTVPDEWEREYENACLAELALEAALYIEEHGWCQGEWWDTQGRVCAIGAVALVLRMGNPLALDAEVVGALLRSEASKVVNASVPTWNDWPGRTADEVIDMWLTVAARFEARV